ncbi:hypothetical protein ALT_1334 [Aspergillus lentulus]|uniref:Acyclic terpene utilisation N-terminal domain-containing protein n=1 Tax=Aspergillus lentulus TaxID=293939 RepID=A0AAN4T7I0_ASPLE|nr:hypothetical protein ALT_1334 [Aspergillus lentulus]
MLINCLTLGVDQWGLQRLLFRDATMQLNCLSTSVAGNVDVIVGDWISKMNIAWNAIAKAGDASLGYEAGFSYS